MLGNIVIRIMLGVVCFTCLAQIISVRVLKTKYAKTANRIDSLEPSERGINIKHLAAYLFYEAYFVLLILFLCFLNLLNLLIPRISLSFLTELVQYLGFMISLTGCLTLAFSYKELKNNWSWPVDECRGKDRFENHFLVKTGIYKHIRHPIYLSGLLIYVGCFLILLSLLLDVFLVLAAAGAYKQARYEEVILTEKYGSCYSEYIRGTGMFFPKIKVKAHRSVPA